MSRARDIADFGSVSARLDTVGASSGSLSNRNLIINGSMQLDQRNGAASVTPTADQTYTLDRFSARLNNASKYSVEQVTDVPSGFYKALKVTSAAATTVGTNDFYQINTPLEGYNTNVLAQGSSAAKQFTLSFYVKSSLTGTFGGAYSNDAGDRFYAWTYTIDSANTWERKSITITGSTDGTWLQTNGSGLWVYWTLGAGSGVQATAGAWGTSFKRGPTGATNVVATSGATWLITGVQLEVGPEATPFEHRSFADELLHCSRYYQEISGGSDAFTFSSKAQGASSVDATVTLRTPLRASPTFNSINSRYFNDGTYVASSSTTPTVSQFSANNSMVVLNCGGFSGLTNNEAGNWGPVSNKLTIDAEI